MREDTMTDQSSEMENKIREYVAGKHQVALEKLQKEHATELKNGLYSDDFQQSCAALEEKFDLFNWLDSAANRASQLNFATHIPKFSHGKCKATAQLVLHFDEKENSGRYVVTGVIKNPPIDVSANAAVLDVSGFLLLEDEQGTLYEKLLCNTEPVQALVAIATSQDQYEAWIDGLSKSLNPKEVQAGGLLKQVFFPVGGDEYHLLGVQTSSSLGHCLFEKINYTKFSEDQKYAREQRRNGAFCETQVVGLSNVLAQKFGGTQPQNVSKLNSTRRGSLYLMPSKPPLWKKTTAVSIINHDDLWKLLRWHSRREIKILKTHLQKSLHRPSTQPTREKRAHLVDQIVSTFFTLGSTLQRENVPGWSINTNLPRDQQLWLDPGRCQDDEVFRSERNNMDWCEVISQNFSQWFNQILADSTKLEPGDVEYDAWKKQLQQEFSRVISIIKETA